MTCILVRPGAFMEYDRLNEAFGHRVPVVWDRRRARNRPLGHADTAPSARHPNRRQKPPLTWTALGFVVVDRPATWARAALSTDVEAPSSTGPQWSYQVSSR